MYCTSLLFGILSITLNNINNIFITITEYNSLTWKIDAASSKTFFMVNYYIYTIYTHGEIMLVIMR